METAASTALKTPTPTVQEKARPVNPVKTQSDVQGSGTTAPRSPESRPTLMVDEQFGTAPIKPESIGGNTNAAGNAISGNMTEGVKLDNGATQKRVNGNQIGVASVPNEKSGVPNVKSPLNCVGTVGGTKKGSSIRQDPTPAPRPLFPPTLMIDERFGAVPAVNPKGFIVNAHSAPFSVTVFGFDPQRISAPAP
jgi:hypothetical protein